jgi:tetratricopeptide (TPR) repeat protein
MRSLPWIVAAAAVLAAAVGTSKLKNAGADEAMETPVRLLAAAQSDIENERPLDAIRKVRRVPTSHRSYSRALQVEGEALLALHFVGRAEQRWLEAIKSDPTLDTAPFHLFGQYFLSERHRDARRLAVELAPKQTSPAVAATMLLETIRQEHERASAPVRLEIFEPVLIREPDNGHAIRTVGRCFVELGRVTEGLALLKKSTEALPEDPETWAIWFESLHDAGRSSRIIGAYASAPAAVKSHARVLRVLAAALEAAGDAKTAEQRLQEVLKSDPFDRKALTQLASLLARRGDDANAQKLADRSKVLDDVREQQAKLLQQARNQDNDPNVDLLRKLAAVCNELGWTDVGGEFDRLVKRRLGRSSEVSGR